MTSSEDDILAAADDIVGAFGKHDTLRYFNAFALDATFIFYSTPDRLESRTAYEALWAKWERENGFHVLGCISTNRRVQTSEDFGIFTHDVETMIELDGLIDTLHERETIVFERRAGRWLGVHEHLSPKPD